MSIEAWFIFGYFVVGTICFSFYGFLNEKLNIRTILAFSISYILVVNIITEQLVKMEFNGDNTPVDDNEWRAKFLRFIFGYNPWEPFFNRINKPE